MKPNFRTCPQCSTRNRLDKEFCVKCGEPLEGVKAGDTAALKKGKPGFIVSADEEGQSPFVPLIFVLMTLGVVLAGWRYVSTQPPAIPVTQGPPRPLVQQDLPAATPKPSDPGAAAYVAGMAALRAADYPGAIRNLREAVAAANRVDYHLGLAEAIEKSGASPSDFLVEYEAAARIAPINARYTSEWAKALNRSGQNTEAMRVYALAIELQPDNVANLREAADLHMRSGDTSGARPYLEKVIQVQPNDVAPRQDLARALVAARDLDGAIRQYQEILLVMPSDDDSRALLSEAYMTQNKADEALRTLNEGLARNPAAPLLHRERGRVLDRRGNAAEAVAAYREYLRLAPGASDVRIFQDRIATLSQ